MASLATGGESKGSAEMSYEEKAKIMMEKDGNTAGIPLAVFIEDPAEFLKILPDDDTADSTAKLDQVRRDGCAFFFSCCFVSQGPNSCALIARFSWLLFVCLFVMGTDRAGRAGIGLLFRC